MQVDDNDHFSPGSLGLFTSFFLIEVKSMRSMVLSTDQGVSKTEVIINYVNFSWSLLQDES